MMALGKRKDGDLEAAANASLPYLYSDNFHYYSAAVSTLTALGPISERLVSALIAGCTTDNGAWAVVVLGSYPPAARKAALPTLVRLVEQKAGNAFGRINALRVLAAHVDERSTDVLRVARLALADENLHENQGFAEIMEAVGAMGPAARPLLPDIFEAYRKAPDKPLFPLQRCRKAIAGIDPEGQESMPALMKLLQHKKATTQALALEALAGYGAKAASAQSEIERLAASKERLVRIHAIEALAALR
jgi:hypothetical protein